jgi:hypothetical protein
MTKNTHAYLQIAAMLVQGFTMLANVVPPKYQPLAVALVGAAQAALALYNHPSDTPAAPAAK